MDNQTKLRIGGLLVLTTAVLSLIIVLIVDSWPLAILLAVIIVGSDPASEVYVRNKQKTCEELGILSDHIPMPEETTKEELLARIDALNADDHVHGGHAARPRP